MSTPTAGAAASSASSSPSGLNWKCRSCAFDNEPGVSKCVVCGTARSVPTSKAEARPPRPPLPPANAETGTANIASLFQYQQAQDAYARRIQEEEDAAGARLLADEDAAAAEMPTARDARAAARAANNAADDLAADSPINTKGPHKLKKFVFTDDDFPQEIQGFISKRYLPTSPLGSPGVNQHNPPPPSERPGTAGTTGTTDSAASTFSLLPGVFTFHPDTGICKIIKDEDGNKRGQRITAAQMDQIHRSGAIHHLDTNYEGTLDNVDFLLQYCACFSNYYDSKADCRFKGGKDPTKDWISFSDLQKFEFPLSKDSRPKVIEHAKIVLGRKFGLRRPDGTYEYFEDPNLIPVYSNGYAYSVGMCAALHLAPDTVRAKHFYPFGRKGADCIANNTALQRAAHKRVAVAYPNLIIGLHLARMVMGLHASGSGEMNSFVPAHIVAQGDRGDSVIMQPAPSQDLVPGAGPHVIAFDSDGVSVRMHKQSRSATSIQGAALANAVRFGYYFDLVESHGADFYNNWSQWFHACHSCEGEILNCCHNFFHIILASPYINCSCNKSCQGFLKIQVSPDSFELAKCCQCDDEKNAHKKERLVKGELDYGNPGRRPCLKVTLALAKTWVKLN